jgi:hypothetical protein
MNVVIIYEHCSAGMKACALLQRASERAGGATRWSVVPWRLNMLQPAALAEEALRQAAQAQLIMVAVSGPAEIPASLLDWLEQWALRRQVQDAALALFDGSDGDRLSATATPALREFANRYSLSLICDELNPTEPELPDLWPELREREVAQTAVMEGILERMPSRHNVRWGINE